MPELNLQQIARAVGGEYAGGLTDSVFYHYTFDTRLVEKGSVFFALAGEREDGHRYVESLPPGPDRCAVVRRDWTGRAAVPLIRVEEPRQAYQTLARTVRQLHPQVRYIAVTGSAGKTTTKEFIASILSRSCRVYKSPANWNNWQGVPFSLLNMPADAEAAVFELAMSNPGIGEIAHLVDILQPNTTVLLNALPVHLEYLGTVENVARAKLEILSARPPDSVSLVNGDCDLFRNALAGQRNRHLFFGRRPEGNDIVWRSTRRDGARTLLEIELAGRPLEFYTNLRNEVQLENLFASIAAAWSCGLAPEGIQKGIEELQPVKGRGVISQERGVTLVDDTYNANPEAMKRMLDWVAREYPPPRIAVLGDMLELGEHELELHREVGRCLAGLSYQHLLAVGTRCRELLAGAVENGFPDGRAEWFASPEEAGRRLQMLASPGTAVLFKASRGTAMEKALAAFRSGR